MSPITIGIIGIVVFLVLIFIRMPIGFALAAVGFVGIIYFRGLGAALSTLGTVPYVTLSTYMLSVIPLFVVMGQFAFHSGLSRDIYSAAYNWIGQLKGGLAIATILACTFFAALCGSSFATAAAFGSVCLPEMRRYRYAPSLATGCIAAGGTLGILIPPSVPLVIYAMLVEESVGKLLLAGFIPGILMAFLFGIITYILCTIRPGLGPSGPRVSLKEMMMSLLPAWQVLIVFAGMMGGLYMGVFTPTEAGAVGAFLVFLIGFVRRRLTWRSLFASAVESVQITAMIFLILTGAMIFSCFLAFSQLPAALAEGLTALQAFPYLVIVLVIVLYLILGCFMDSLAMVLLTVPIIYPLLGVMGFDLIWFGIIVVLMMEMAQITPPFGMNVYVISGIAKDIPLKTIFKGIVPYLVGMIACVVIIVAFPQIALFLPYTMK